MRVAEVRNEPGEGEKEDVAHSAEVEVHMLGLDVGRAVRDELLKRR